MHDVLKRKRLINFYLGYDICCAYITQDPYILYITRSKKLAPTHRIHVSSIFVHSNECNETMPKFTICHGTLTLE